MTQNTFKLRNFHFVFDNPNLYVAKALKLIKKKQFSCIQIIFYRELVMESVMD